MIQQELKLNVAAFMGYTDWLPGVPPRIGWWATVFVDQQEEDPEFNKDRTLRRFWNGSTWSQPVVVGCSQEDADWSKSQISQPAHPKLLWSGLASDPSLCRRGTESERISCEAEAISNVPKKPRIKLVRPRLRLVT